MSKFYESTTLTTLDKYKDLFADLRVRIKASKEAYESSVQKVFVCELIESTVSTINNLYSKGVETQDFIEKSIRYITYIRGLTSIHRKNEGGKDSLYLRDINDSYDIKVLSGYKEELKTMLKKTSEQSSSK